MRRRDFLKAAVLGSIASGLGAEEAKGSTMTRIPLEPLTKRRFKDDVELSILGFGGIVVMGLTQKESDRIVGEAFDRGVNYFDVAPSYGEGEAEEKLGRALQPYRSRVFLACKTLRRDAQGAREELERSLKRLRTDHFDLYQYHAVTELEDVEKTFALGGAAETFLKAREQGKIRYVGFSAHSEQAALAMMERFEFDSVLFPINFVCYAQGNFGPRVVNYAKERGVARLALKSLAHTPWPEGMEHRYPKCWYRPVDDRRLAEKALRFTLSEDVTAAIPPGDEQLFRLSLELAKDFLPLTSEERAELLSSAEALEPLFKL